MDEMSDLLARVFCEDCSLRMQRVVRIVQYGGPLSRTQLDQLHQEFDTMFGGARAVHLPELEHYFRNMARYARHLRNFLKDGEEIGSGEWQYLYDGVQMGQRCCNDLCGSLHINNEECQRLMHDIENVISSADTSGRSQILK